MVLCDTNIWIAMSLSGHSHHSLVAEWLDGISEADSVHFCRSTQTSFLRLLSSSKVLKAFGNPPLSNAEAWEVYNSLLRDFRIWQCNREPQGLEAQWNLYSMRDSASPKLWMDAYLAAFAQTGGYQLVTLDKAFTQFEGLDALVLAG